MGLIKECMQCFEKYSKRKPYDTKKSKFCSAKCHHKSMAYTKEQIKRKIRYNYERKIIKKEGCWDWSGTKSAYGYGIIHYGDGKTIHLHRASWLIYKGEIPQGIQVHHSCDNRICSNPDHLWIGTQYENMQDMIRKGRQKPFIGLKGESNKQHKLTDEKVIEIKLMLKNKISLRVIANKFNVSKGCINHIHRNTTWTHINI